MKIDCHNHIGVDPLFYMKGWAPYALDLENLLLQARSGNVDCSIVFPFVSYLGLSVQGLQAGEIVFDGLLDRIPYRFENQRMLEEVYLYHPESSDRSWPLLIADPARHQAEQVECWKQLPSEYKFYGIKIQATIIRSPILALLDEGRCMLDFAEERNLPFLIHSSVNDQWSQCADILRVAESRPGIRFVLAHSCRYDHPSLLRVAELPNTWFDCSAHVIHCECAVRGLEAVAPVSRRFPTDYSSPETVLRDLATAFPDKLIWGSDAPFYSYADAKMSLHSTYLREVECLDSLPAELIEKISHLNTLAWLKGT